MNFFSRYWGSAWLVLFLFSGLNGLKGQCTDPFFAEYLEGSSNNKAYEIYNPSSDTLDLTDYRVELYNNGATSPSSSLVPQGILLPGQVFVVANSSADMAILNQSDTISSTTFFNGNDALILLDISDSLNIDTLDAIGIVGANPGSNGWAVGTGFTKENTLVRKIGIQQGTANWTAGAAEWDVYPQNTFSFLGAHNMQPCAGSSGPVIGFSAVSQVINEGGGSATVTIQLSNASVFNTTTVVVNLGAGTAVNGNDFSYVFPDTLSWLSGDSSDRTVVIPITDDLLVENQESIDLTLGSPSNGATLATAAYTVLIDDNDVHDYTISQVTGLDTNGVADSLGAVCRLRGVVYGVDLNGGNPLQFTLIDPTDGIGVFSNAQASGYVVAEGDSIGVIGTISQFNGLTQITIDSVEFYSAGNALKPATLAATLDETTESDLIQLSFMHLVDPAQWTGSGSGFNVDITNGTDTLAMRIDNEVDLYSQSPPTGNFDVCGLGGQFDSSSPYTSGYQLLPRYQADLKLLAPPPSVSLRNDTALCGGDSVLLDAGIFTGVTYLWSTGENTQQINAGSGTFAVTVTDSLGQTGTDSVVISLLPDPVAEFTCDSTLAPQYTFTSTAQHANFHHWDFGDGDTSNVMNPSHTFADGMWTVTLVVGNTCSTDTITKDLDFFTGRAMLAVQDMQVYPNPTTGWIWLEQESLTGPADLHLFNGVGQVVVQRTVSQSKQQVDLTGLPNGVYLLCLSNGEGVWRKHISIFK